MKLAAVLHNRRFQFYKLFLHLKIKLNLSPFGDKHILVHSQTRLPKGIWDILHKHFKHLYFRWSRLLNYSFISFFLFFPFFFLFFFFFSSFLPCLASVMSSEVDDQARIISHLFSVVAGREAQALSSASLFKDHSAGSSNSLFQCRLATSLTETGEV